MDSSPPSASSNVSTKVSIIAITAVLYAIGKGITAFIPTPWGVGQLLIGIFLPAFFAVVSETVPVAVGAGLGTFMGDALFLTPLGNTNPALSLIAGVPANFVGILLFGWFVKRYRSWPAFIAGAISFVTLGNLIAAIAVVSFGAAVFTPVNYLITHFDLAGLVLGLTVFWNMTSIPAIVIGVPLLIRSVRPLFGRSRILQYEPDWSTGVGKNGTAVATTFAVLFLLLGVVFFVLAPSSLTLWPGLTTYFAVAAALVLIFAPITSVVAGSKLSAKRAEG
ncbi:MAG: hypothetical protein LYZ69_00335 [Nitrososphaerales archaeon]|nr:hypothetical protein [Nitrososphaerales archaeon]